MVREKPIGRMIKNEIGQREDVAAVGLSRPRPQKDLGQGSLRPGPRQCASQGAGQEARPWALLRKDGAH